MGLAYIIFLAQIAFQVRMSFDQYPIITVHFIFRNIKEFSEILCFGIIIDRITIHDSLYAISIPILEQIPDQVSVAI